MMIECAPENRASIVASLDSTAALLFLTSAITVFDSTMFGSLLPDARLHEAAADMLALVVVEQDHAAVRADELERLVEDLRQQLVEVELAADRARQLVADAQALVVAAQDLVVGDLALRHEVAGVGLDAAADVALGQAGRDRHALERVVGLRLVDEHDARRAHRELVAVAEVVVADPLAAHERAVQRAQVAQQVAPVGRALDLRVLLRDDAIEDLDRVVGMPADRVEGGELELLPLLPGDDDQLGHRDARKTARSMVRRPAAPSKGGIATNSSLLHGKPVSPWHVALVLRARAYGICTGRPPSDRGGIGRRAGLRCQWVTPWGFESPRSHEGRIEDHDAAFDFSATLRRVFIQPDRRIGK